MLEISSKMFKKTLSVCDMEMHETYNMKFEV